MKIKPVAFVCDENWNMVPVARYLPLAKRQFEPGHEYIFEPVGFRNMKSHSHFFSWLHEAWDNLPEEVAKQFPSAEHLRHKALVETGFYTETLHPCETVALAKSMALFARKRAPYAVIVRSGTVVRIWDAESQSVPAMKPDRFQESKVAVMDWVAALNPGLSKDAISKQADEHAPRDRQPSTTQRSSENEERRR